MKSPAAKEAFKEILQILIGKAVSVTLCFYGPCRKLPGSTKDCVEYSTSGFNQGLCGVLH